MTTDELDLWYCLMDGEREPHDREPTSLCSQRFSPVVEWNYLDELPGAMKHADLALAESLARSCIVNRLFPASLTFHPR